MPKGYQQAKPLFVLIRDRFQRFSRLFSLPLCSNKSFQNHIVSWCHLKNASDTRFATQRYGGDFVKVPSESCSTHLDIIMPLVRISWPHGCKHLAMLAGSWSQWHPQVLMPTKLDNLKNELWSTHVKLPDDGGIAIYRFKFVVDGEWVFDADQPHMANEYGSYDNYIEVLVTRSNLGQLLRKQLAFSHSFALWPPRFLLILLRIRGFAALFFVQVILTLLQYRWEISRLNTCKPWLQRKK